MISTHATGRIPRLVYEALPFVYSLVGLTTIANNDITLGRLLGALLLSAAVIILTMRKLIGQHDRLTNEQIAQAKAFGGAE